jgi:hypothetical protein
MNEMETDLMDTRMNVNVTCKLTGITISMQGRLCIEGRQELFCCFAVLFSAGIPAVS